MTSPPAHHLSALQPVVTNTAPYKATVVSGAETGGSSRGFQALTGHPQLKQFSPCAALHQNSTLPK